ncbi:keratin-associated protein 5-4-like [Papaver somniferum]|uniref:keratin-associated protein 5-4-like n=1 Tax=Papaver somniferum TaxID=3469 RepID=UPI000E6F7D85|nr:keratin-associated protein 5-4-like [Papaver somniferum]
MKRGRKRSQEVTSCNDPTPQPRHTKPLGANARNACRVITGGGIEGGGNRVRDGTVVGSEGGVSTCGGSEGGVAVTGGTEFVVATSGGSEGGLAVTGGSEVGVGGGSEGGVGVTGGTEVGVGTSRINEGDPNEEEEENLAETSDAAIDKAKYVMK